MINGKVIYITGGSSGIGLALARYFPELFARSAGLLLRWKFQ